ncbi:hypothetical protein K461DRAFT_312149 [Myriangium duriaei CBS 260.36]|uniref:Uncharacterized protein n=1 Tax=Myriangium duriaei CBS 260.36 TaxID=1168546 RepID=A0A9P4J2C8_9PEZI|nr:hypothetical protein K461DRAFT_312149 [Myriangium duriaei CBS 260.36]
MAVISNGSFLFLSRPIDVTFSSSIGHKHVGIFAIEPFHVFLSIRSTASDISTAIVIVAAMFLFPLGIAGVMLPIKETAHKTAAPAVQFTKQNQTHQLELFAQPSQTEPDRIQTAASHLKAAKENLPIVHRPSADSAIDRHTENIDYLPISGPRFVNRPHGRPLSAIIEQRSIASLRSKCSARFGSFHPKTMQSTPENTSIQVRSYHKRSSKVFLSDEENPSLSPAQRSLKALKDRPLSTVELQARRIIVPPASRARLVAITPRSRSRSRSHRRSNTDSVRTIDLIHRFPAPPSVSRSQDRGRSPNDIASPAPRRAARLPVLALEDKMARTNRRPNSSDIGRERAYHSPVKGDAIARPPARMGSDVHIWPDVLTPRTITRPHSSRLLQFPSIAAIARGNGRADVQVSNNSPLPDDHGTVSQEQDIISPPPKGKSRSGVRRLLSAAKSRMGLVEDEAKGRCWLRRRED